MLALILGAVVLFALFGSARAFERASVTSIKALLAWIVALGGLALALLLILTGRTSIALGALALFGPLIYQEWQSIQGRSKPGRSPGRGGSARGSRSGGGQSWDNARRRGSMTRAEALEILGLRPGASPAEIKDAHHRLMRAAHPDAGGSDWLAARINQARDVLIG
jgi:DnaJ family protein C protein 19